MSLDEETLAILSAQKFEQESDKEEVSVILDLLEKHFVGESNVTFERFKFFKQDQWLDEPFFD